MDVWKLLWQKCGYKTDKTSLYAQLYVQHILKKEISRKQWFDFTCDAFQKAGLTEDQFLDVSNKISLIPGVKETIVELTNKGYDLYIVSGCIKQTIEKVLGEYVKYFRHIESNNCLFDKDGLIQSLIPTLYDYEGKAQFVENLKQEGYATKDIVFVGNADNDEWVYKTGCKTICINPDGAEITNRKKWKHVYKNVSNLSHILPTLITPQMEIDNFI